MEHQYQNKCRSSRQHFMYAHSVDVDAGGRGTRISSATSGARMGSGFAPLYFGFTATDLAIANEKIMMQQLNSRLIKYMDKIKELEHENSSLEEKINRYRHESGYTEGKSNMKEKALIKQLSEQINEKAKRNTYLRIEFENALRASHDFKSKMEYQRSLSQDVDGDIAELRKDVDDTNLLKMNLETEVERLRVERITQDKVYEEGKDLLINQGSAAVNVDIDAAEGQDLGKVLAEMREKYGKITKKNKDKVKMWFQEQIKEVSTQVTESSEALKKVALTATDLKKKCQTLELELRHEINIRKVLEGDLDVHTAQNDASLQGKYAIIQNLKEEQNRIQTEMQNKKRDYDNLLNIKVKLEAEINEYRRILDGGESFRLEDAIETKRVTTQVVTTTQTLVNGKVVSEERDIRSTGSKK